MALDINGYNATFKAFTDFATQSIEAGEKKAIARADGTGGLANRTIQPASGDWVGKIRRSNESRDANNVTRGLFKQAIIDMFGGENNIPASVKKAMLLSDYGKGKPLTARRIIAVKNAIDKDGTMMQKGFDESISVFKNEESATAALAKGYAKGEFPKLAKAVNLLVETTHCSEAEALEQVTTAGSKANRLMNYGGRFLQSADNFKNGMRLLDTFNSWFDETGAALRKVHPTPMESHFEEGMSKTLLNGWETMFRAEYKIPVERFVFEEIANNPSANLAEKNANKLFSMENNQAMGSIARNMLNGRTQTVAQIPPEKRATFFKALNTICPLVSSAEEARVPPSERHAIKGRNLDAPVARLLKNLDSLIALDSQKKLTAKNLVKLCFPEIKKPSADPASDVVDLVNQWDDDINENGDECKYPREDCAAMGEAMKATGCSVEEAALIAKGKLQLPNVPYFSSGTLGLRDGPEAARNQLIGDLDRGVGYNYIGGPELLKTTGFRFNLPGGESLFANKTPQFKGNIPVIADKLEALCGPTHKAQARSLLMMTCQSGLGPLLNGLKSYGVESTEHSSVDFTITKNADTGDISIRYSSPEELPFAFEWTATIKPDGYVSSTPIRFTDELATLKRETAEAADKLKKSMLASYREKSGYDPTQDAIMAGEINKSVDAIFSGVGADRDLLALLQTNKMAEGVLLNAANRIRSPEKVAKTVAGLKGNLDELRAAANGNQRVFNVGLKHIAYFGGTALKSGILTKMCEMIAKEDLGAFRNVSAASSPEKILDALCRLDRLIAKIFDETEILKTLGEVGAGESTTAKGLVMGLVFAHCGEDTVNGLKSALESPNAKKLESVLMDTAKGNFPPGASVEPQIRIAISDYADAFNMTFRYEMYGALNEALGIDNDNVDMLEPRDDKTPASPKSQNAIFDTMKEYTLVMEERRISRPNLADLPPKAAQ